VTKDDAGVWITFRETSGPIRAILLGTFISRLGGFVQTFLVLFLTHRGFSKVEAGTAFGSYGVGAVVGVFLGGVVADRLGPRRATLLSMLGSGALLMTVIYIRSFPALLGVIALVAVVTQLYRPAMTALLVELTPKHRRVMIMAMLRLATNLGTMVAPLLAVALISVSYNALFWVDGATNIGYAVVAAIALPRKKINPAAKPTSPSEPTGYRTVLADRRYLLYLAAIFINSAAYVQLVTSLPLAMEDAGIATAWFGALITLNGAMVLSCELLVTKFVQRWQPRHAGALSLALLGLALAVVTPQAGLAIFVVAGVLATTSEIIGQPTLFAYPGLIAGPGQTARYTAAMQTTWAMGTAIGASAGVALWSAIGKGSWWCWGLASLAAGALLWSGIRRKARTPEPAVLASVAGSEA